MAEACGTLMVSHDQISEIDRHLLQATESVSMGLFKLVVLHQKGVPQFCSRRPWAS